MKTAKLFKNGRSQAVRLPQEYRFSGEEIYIKQYGDIVILIPKKSPWKSMIESVDEFSDDYMETRNQPAPQTRESVE
jgi:antitoxin VapB